MEASGEELGRIVAFVNRRPWLMESSHGDPVDDKDCSSYFLDRLGTTAFGDNSLHRICAWHATPDQFKTFLNHMKTHQEQCDKKPDHQPLATKASSSSTSSYGPYDRPRYQEMPSPPSLGQTNHRGATALHVAVYRNAFHANSIVEQLLQKEPSLASIPMDCGSYPLHILCAHNVTIRRDILQTLLDADPSVVWREDQHGDTPLSLLWKNVLRFRWAQQEHVVFEEDDDLMDIETPTTTNSNPRYGHRRPSWMTVITPEQYVEFSLMMIRAALHKQPHRPWHLVDICQMPRCPPLLLKLILQQNSKIGSDLLKGPLFWKATDVDHGMTALHHAARVNSVTWDFVSPHVRILTPHSVVDCLLDHYPSLALVKDARGRIALHYALEKAFHSVGHRDECTEQLHRFTNANPDSLRIKDPASGLYPFALLAAQSTTTKSHDDLQDMDDSMARSLDHLDTVFWLLRSFPEAALYRD